MQEQSPSPGAQDWQRGEHESRDPTKKTLPAKKVAGSKDGSQLPSDKESDKQKKQAAVKEKAKPTRRGGFDSYRGAQGGEQARLSRKDWPALPAAAGVAGVKRAAPSQSPKKVATKVACQIQMQQRVQQQAMHLAQTRIFLLSAPMGTPKLYETSKKSLAGGTDEWERLNREARATQALFTHTGKMGETQMVLTQPAQATRIVEPPMPRIQPEELRLRNASVALKDQARAQNLVFFVEKEKQQEQSAMSDAVAQLVIAFTGLQAQTPSLLQQMLPPFSPQLPAILPLQPTAELPLAEGMHTDMQGAGMSQSDEMMIDGSRAQESGSKGPMEGIKET